MDKKERGIGKGRFLHVWRGGDGGDGEGDFIDGMPGWRYFSPSNAWSPS